MKLSASEKKLLQSLHEREHFLRQITQGIPDIVYVLDLEKNVMAFTNQRAVEILGRENFMLDHIHPSDIGERVNHLYHCRSLAENDVMEVDLRLWVSPGYWQWFRIRDIAFKRAEDGHVTHVIGIVRNIQDHKLAEEVLAEKNALLQGILNAPNVGLAAYKTIRNYNGEILDYEFILTSKSFEEFHGRSGLAGKWVFEEFPHLKHQSYQEWKELVETGLCYARIEPHIKDGAEHWFNLKHSKLNDGFLVIWEEISKETAEVIRLKQEYYAATFPRS